MTAISPLAPSAFPTIPVLAGVRMTGHACGIRYQGRPDLLLVEVARAARWPASIPAR